MTIYLSGPMRGHADHNFPLFNAVAAQLRDQGYTIINPTEMGDSASPRGVLMGEDLLAILQKCAAVACLPDWRHSPGACAEVAVAFATDKPVFDVIQSPLKNGQLILVESPCTAVTVPRESQYKNKTPLIGLCGFAQSGKDTVAGFLVDNGWTRVAFADKLRDMLYALNPFIVMKPRAWRDVLNPFVVAKPRAWRAQELVDKWGWDVAKVQYPEMRQLLQKLGTEAGREVVDDNLWVSLGEQQIEAAGGPVVVTDARFPNELQLIRRRGGILCWIERDGIGAVNGHASEHSVSQADCDFTIKNNGTLEDLKIAVLSELNGGVLI